MVKNVGSDIWLDIIIPESDIYNPIMYLVNYYFEKNFRYKSHITIRFKTWLDFTQLRICRKVLVKSKSWRDMIEKRLGKIIA